MAAAVTAAAYTQDEASASAECEAQFRRDVESYIAPETASRLVPRHRELGPAWNARYVAFCDPAGGGGDSMRLAVAQFDHVAAKAGLDLVVEIRPPFSPEVVVEEFAAILARYRVRIVTGDRYAGDWPASVFKRHGVVYRPSERTKSELYRDVLPMLNSGAVELLDEQRLTRQLLGLERRTGASGRDIIDHAPGQHDDVINAACGALLLASGRRARRTGFDASEIRVTTADPLASLPRAGGDVRVRKF